MFVNLGLGTNREFVDPRTASLGVKSSKRNRELENSASLGPRVCEVLLYREKLSALFIDMECLH